MFEHAKKQLQMPLYEIKQRYNAGMITRSSAGAEKGGEGMALKI
jgi:hypothetical protein